MYHYTYIITNNTDNWEVGKYYIGVRSCNCHPTQDVAYLGSSRYLSEDIERLGKESFNKNIICIFDNRQDAMLHEIELHQQFDVEKNELFYNKINASAEGFTWLGQTHSEVTRKKIQEKRSQQKITAEQIEKFKKTWANKTKEEIEDYKKYRKKLWNNKSPEEKDKFRQKMSSIVSEYWKKAPQEEKIKRVKKTLATKSNWTKEQKEKDFKNRSVAQKKIKNNRTGKQIRNTVGKRRKTYENMSPERLNDISNKRSKQMKGRKWYNNGQVSKMFFEHEVPKGFYPGRKF